MTERHDDKTNLLDLGPYANDRRLVRHDEHHAAFYGEHCNPAVYLSRQPSGTFYASQSRTGERDGKLVALEPTNYSNGATAAEALAQIIGPVQPREVTS